MKVFVIDDQPSVLRNIKLYLEKQGWDIDTAETYDEAKQKLTKDNFDVIVCDYYLSSEKNAKQGIHLIKEIRKENIQTPVIFLTARKIDEITPWDALDVGGDDFIKKPWKPKEVIARIKAAARRGFHCDKNSTNVLEHDGVKMDLDLRKVIIGDREMYPSNILFTLLKRFLQKPDIPLTYQSLISYVWGEDNSREEDQKNKLRVHMTHLKKLLGKEISTHLRTIRERGYMWESTKIPKKQKA